LFNCFKNFAIALVVLFLAFMPLGHSIINAAGLAGLGSKIFGEDVDASADNLTFVGDNIIAEGHVSIRYKEIWVTADKAIINMSTKDVEATGRVKFIQRKRRTQEITYEEYLKLLKDPDVKVTRNGYIMTPSGRQLVDVTIVEEIHSWTGKRAVGNLTTGIFDLGEFSGKYDAYYISGKHAERTPKGTIRVKDVKLTTCEYVEDHHEHYSVTASSITIWPDKTTDDSRYLQDSGHYSILAYNGVLRVYDVPIFYFPVIYKPAWDRGPGISVKGGQDSDWGYFIQLKKTFKLWNYPNTNLAVYMDYFSKRGPGGGVELTSTTQDSSTEFFMYGVHDKGVDDRKGRFEFPTNRYDIRLSHLNHITPRLDFRGHLEKLSDINFLHDFFRSREDVDPQPVSFGALEYQFDRLSLGAYVRPRLNNFYSVVEKLPELRIDVPRQELFKNLYYQGEMSLSYMRMKWRKYDFPRNKGGIDISNYQSMRFDSLNMFYYPFKLSKINIIPRAGVRFTSYSKTSKTKIDLKQLETYGIVDSPYSDNPGTIVNYDSQGGMKLRVAAEFGLEANTKIYRSWQDAKSAFWEIDGFRHIMVPYINYNFMPSPTLSRDKIYYFDDTDRLEEQHFIRIGVKNRLQTRRGAYGAQEIYDWASVEHYMDFHFNKQNSDYVGDFGTIVRFQPFPSLSSSADLLINLGKGSISRFAPSISYDINEDWKLSAGYYYQNEYTERSAYSMGSALTDITSGSAFERHYSKNQSIHGGIEFPIIDDKTRGEARIDYNLEASMLDEARFGIVRTLHCWEVGFEYRIRQRNDDIGDNLWEHMFMFTLSLTAVPSFKITAQQGVGGGEGGGANN
jgi:lipopolysaccharide assembly outer membrane protein LptD (OstA)